MVNFSSACDTLQSKNEQHRWRHRLKSIEMDFTGGNLWILQQSG